MQLVFLAVLWLAGVAACGALVLLGAWATWHLALMACAVVVSAWAAFSSWQSTPSDWLKWDGKAWCWQSASNELASAQPQPTVVADLQRFLLLRLPMQPGGVMWFWAERQALPERWMDFRRAIYSPHRPAAALPDVDEAMAPSVKQQRR